MSVVLLLKQVDVFYGVYIYVFATSSAVVFTSMHACCLERYFVSIICLVVFSKACVRRRLEIISFLNSYKYNYCCSIYVLYVPLVYTTSTSFVFPLVMLVLYYTRICTNHKHHQFTNGSLRVHKRPSTKRGNCCAAAVLYYDEWVASAVACRVGVFGRMFLFFWQA